MKPRVLQTMKILAVGLTATAAACQRTPTPDTQSTTSTVAPAPASASAIVDPPGVRPMAEDPKLFGLREELLATARHDAAALDVAHFRPLCDKDGYPLVGNVMRKTVGTTEPQPSALCARVRQEKAK